MQSANMYNNITIYNILYNTIFPFLSSLLDSYIIRLRLPSLCPHSANVARMMQVDSQDYHKVGFDEASLAS